MRFPDTRSVEQTVFYQVTLLELFDIFQGKIVPVFVFGQIFIIKFPEDQDTKWKI